MLKVLNEENLPLMGNVSFDVDEFCCTCCFKVKKRMSMIIGFIIMFKATKSLPTCGVE